MMDRREFLVGSAAVAAAVVLPNCAPVKGKALEIRAKVFDGKEWRTEIRRYGRNDYVDGVDIQPAVDRFLAQMKEMGATHASQMQARYVMPLSPGWL